MIQTRIFKISGMHCASCAMNIDGELEDSLGVIEAKTSYAKQETAITFEDSQTSPAAIREIIKKTGYLVDN